MYSARALTDRLLSTRDYSSLYWLARLDSKNAIVPAWLAELLQLGCNFSPYYPENTKRIFELLSIANIHAYTLDDAKLQLLAAAMIRPVWICPNMQSMWDILSFFSEKFQSIGASNAFLAMSNYVRNNVRLDIATFLPRNNNNDYEKRVKLFKEQTQEFWDSVLAKHTEYMPAMQVRQDIFTPPHGIIGYYLQKCIDEKSVEILQFALRSWTEKDIIRILDDNRYTPQTGLETNARQRIFDDISQAVDIINKWAALFTEFSPQRNLNISQGLSQLEDFIVCVKDIVFPQTPVGGILREQFELIVNCREQGLPFDNVNPLNALKLHYLLFPINVLKGKEGIGQYLSNHQSLTINMLIDNILQHMEYGDVDSIKEYLKLYPKISSYSVSDVFKYRIPPHSNPGVDFSMHSIWVLWELYWRNAFSMEKDIFVQKLTDAYASHMISKDMYIRLTISMRKVDNGFSSEPNKVEAIHKLQMIGNELSAYIAKSGNRVSKTQNSLITVANSFYHKMDKNEIDQIMLPKIWLDAKEKLMNQRIAKTNDTPQPARSSKALTLKKIANYSLMDAYDHVETYVMRSGLRAFKKIKSQIVGETNPLTSNAGGSLGATHRNMTIVKTILSSIGLRINTEELPENVFESGKPYFWRAIRYSESFIASPLPKWGSLASGKHTIIFGWNVTSLYDIATILDMPFMKQNPSVIMFIFSKLSFQQRRQLIKYCSEKRVNPIIIDENLYKFLTASSGDVARMLFDVALAGSDYNPYTIAKNDDMPPEMFFGRTNEIKQLLSPQGACVVTGGCWSGKTALLKVMKDRYENEKNIFILRSLSTTDAPLLNSFATFMRDAGIIPDGLPYNAIYQKVNAWLCENPDKRIFLLLDDCDEAFSKEVVNHFSGISFLTKLMLETGYRFKVIFAGRLKTLRAINMPSNPLFYYTQPIILGTLEPESAKKLMVEPLKTLGVEFTSEADIAMALRFCRYQPKFIKLFCRELFFEMRDFKAGEPFCQLSKAQVLKMCNYRQLTRLISEWFGLTLSLDDRYFVIMVALATCGGSAMISKLAEILKYYWSKAFSDKSKNYDSICTLLWEMENFGLVYSSCGKWHISLSNYIAHLGGQDIVMNDLNKYMYKEFSDNSVQSPRVLGAEVLTANQYAFMYRNESKCCWISAERDEDVDRALLALCRIAGAWYGGEKALSLSREKIKEAIDNNILAVYNILSPYPANALKEAKNFVARYDKGGILLFMSSKVCSDIAIFSTIAEQWINSLDQKPELFVKIVCLVYSNAMQNLIKSNTLSSMCGSHILIG